MTGFLNYRIDSNKNIDYMIEIFETAAAECNGSLLSFNPLFYSSSTQENNVDMLTVADIRRGFGRFFKYYVNRPNKFYHEREAETFLGLVNGVEAKGCVYCDCRVAWVGVASNGDLWPCDRNFGDEYRYGNIVEFNNVTDLLLTSGFSKSWRHVEKRIKNLCSKCRYFAFCNGGCNGRHIAMGSLETVDNSMCNLFHTLYSLAKEALSNDSKFYYNDLE